MLWMVRNILSRLWGPAGFGNACRTVCRTTCRAVLLMVAYWSCRPRLFCLHVRDMLALRRSRRQLAELAPHRRADVGVTAGQVEEECRAPLLGEISPWASLELRAAVNAARRPSTPPPPHERSFYRARGRHDLPGTG